MNKTENFYKKYENRAPSVDILVVLLYNKIRKDISIGGKALDVTLVDREVLLKSLHILNGQITRDSNGWPMGYIDCTLLMDLLERLEGRRLLLDKIDNNSLTLGDFGDSYDQKSLFVPFIYVDGDPWNPSGTPYWERIENEPIDYFKLFKEYRDASMLNLLYTKKNKHKEYKARSMYAIAEQNGLSGKDIITIGTVFHWHERAQAYDNYIKKNLAEEQEAKKLYIEGEHGKTGERLFELAVNYIENNQDQLTPKVALEWLEVAAKLQRISAGLPPDRPISTEQQDKKDDRRAWVQVNVNNGNEHEQGEKQESNDDLTTRLGNILGTLQDSHIFDITEDTDEK